MSDKKNSFEDYARLFNRCHTLAKKISQHQFQKTPSAKIQFIFNEAEKLSSASELKADSSSSTSSFSSQPSESSSAVDEILRLFEQNLSDVLNEKIDLVDLIEENPERWTQFMIGFPLGDYGSLAAEVLIKNQLLSGKVLELGAGVGNTSRLIADHVNLSEYIRTDLNIKLLKKVPVKSKIALYNFNEPGRWENLDTIFATNALHCASDKKKTLGYLFEMLKSGGALVLAEGNPHPSQNTPWALNFLCGLYEGWWDQGGFLPREEWQKLLISVGFQKTEFVKLKAQNLDFGGVIVARKNN